MYLLKLKIFYIEFSIIIQKRIIIYKLLTLLFGHRSPKIYEVEKNTYVHNYKNSKAHKIRNNNKGKQRRDQRI